MSKTVNYELIARSINYYKDLGYRQVEAPWLIHESASKHTKPTGSMEFVVNDGKSDTVLPASGEQSFIHMSMTGELEVGKYQTVTPCFRDDIPDELHQTQFIKNELIIVDPAADDLDNMVHDATKLFGELFREPIHVQQTDIGFDIEYNGMELGSYGYRTLPNGVPYIYGTGLAEPRTSILLAKQTPPTGYHTYNIPKSNYGTLDKVTEEYLELMDARLLESPVLELVELTDLIGAIAGYANARYNITLDELVKFSKMTSDSFKSGKRK